jgi:hypothetical protein
MPRKELYKCRTNKKRQRPGMSTDLPSSSIKTSTTSKSFLKENGDLIIIYFYIQKPLDDYLKKYLN